MSPRWPWERHGMDEDAPVRLDDALDRLREITKDLSVEVEKLRAARNRDEAQDGDRSDA